MIIVNKNRGFNFSVDSLPINANPENCKKCEYYINIPGVDSRFCELLHCRKKKEDAPTIIESEEEKDDKV